MVACSAALVSVSRCIDPGWSAGFVTATGANGANTAPNRHAGRASDLHAHEGVFRRRTAMSAHIATAVALVDLTERTT